MFGSQTEDRDVLATGYFEQGMIGARLARMRKRSCPAARVLTSISVNRSDAGETDRSQGPSGSAKTLAH